MISRSCCPLTSTALAYTWRQLVQRVGSDSALEDTSFKSLGVSLHYAQPDRVQSDQPYVVVIPCAEDAWQKLLDRAPNSLDWLPAHEVVPPEAKLPFTGLMPVLFRGEGFEDGRQPFAELRPDGTVVFYVDIIAATFFMLSRWEETVVSIRDEHGRFPGTASVAYKQGFLDRPVVDEYALILREWLKVLLPGWRPNPRSFSVKLSHDVDKLFYFSNWYAAIRTFGGDLLKRRSPRRAWQTGIRVVVRMTVPHRTPYFQGICSLAELSRKYGMSDDAFYFMATEPRPFESNYTLASPVVRQCIENLRDWGFEIGIHAGYHTLKDPDRLATEKARLDAVLGDTQHGGRQHYLRFRVPDTWRHWEQVGLVYDSTMTYADHEGFRCGTCHPFRPFDVEQNREFDLWEIPLIVMDGTLRDYRKLTPEQGEARILVMARRCQQVEGTFTLLWHNSSLDEEWQPWGEMYRRVVKVLACMQEGAYVGSDIGV